jgi:hypothetical protein
MTGWHAQKWPAETFARITRTSHEPGNRLHTSCAMQAPIPRLRYPRITKNSAISQTISFPHSSDPLFTKTNPANLPATETRNGCRSELAPVEGKALVSNPAIRSKIQILEFTEVVPVQLKQVSQDRLLLWSSGGNFDMRGFFSCGFCHSRKMQYAGRTSVPEQL